MSNPLRLAILGATGSIGRSTFSLIACARDRFSVSAIAAGSNALALAQIARDFHVPFVAIADEAAYCDLKEALAGTKTEVAAGPQAVVEAALRADVDRVVAAIAGTAGVHAVYEALKLGRCVALANKEALVCAGGPVMKMAHQSQAQILPMDSEHNAIFQVLGGRDLEHLHQMILTASGGPFRTFSHDALQQVTPEQALAHPNWQMGPKITVDCASLMNKGLELIEAHYLFDVPASKLDVLVHPQSIVHGLVSFTDGAMLAGMAIPDMCVPIANCLAWPKRMDLPKYQLDLATLSQLTFEKPDFGRFPCLQLAQEALCHENGMTTVLNAVNEVAVHAFLQHRLAFHRIPQIISQVCELMLQQGDMHAPDTLEDALALDGIARERARKKISNYAAHSAALHPTKSEMLPIC